MRSHLLILLCLTQSIASASERVLFAFDENAIPWHFNTKVTMVPAVKHAGNPVLRKGPPGAHRHDAFVRAFAKRFGEDSRVLMWEICNEPEALGNDEVLMQFLG